MKARQKRIYVHGAGISIISGILLTLFFAGGICCAIFAQLVVGLIFLALLTGGTLSLNTSLDFLRQIFSEKALIIVGNVVKTAPEQDGFTAGQRVEYYLRTKSEYLNRLSHAFAASRKINVKFSDFRILRHPTMDGIYGVSLRQRYSSDQYSDDGWLFLLWDFRNEAMPLVHVRTWQPATEIRHGDEIINMSDFNLK